MTPDVPCAGKHKIFDSTSAHAHAEARKLCGTCPAITWCRRRLEEARRDAHAGGYPQGTWAGQLVGGEDKRLNTGRNVTCARCNTNFTATGTGGTKYCSNDCRRAADREYRRLRRRAA